MLAPILALALALALALVLPAGRAKAADFRRIDVDPARAIVVLEGSIIPGDTARLTQFLTTALDGHQLAALALDSPGGVVTEAAQLGYLVRRINASVLVGRNAQCLSACFLIFAASPRRAAMPDARIGVHSATTMAGESDRAMAMTTQMARLCAKWGVPNDIIVRMVATAPNAMSILTPRELSMMGVIIGASP